MDELALVRAAADGDELRVAALLDAGVGPDPRRVHPLAEAAAAGHEGVVELLLVAGARIDRVHEGLTPLLRAAQAGQRRMVERLLEEGALLRPDGAPRGALELATEGHHFELVRWLEQASRQRPPPRVGVRYRPGRGEPGWAMLAEQSLLHGNEERSLVLVHAPIAVTTPAVHRAQGSDRMLLGIDQRPQPVDRYARARYLVQLVGCSWTLFVHDGGNVVSFEAGRQVARAVSERLGVTTIYSTYDDTSEVEEFTTFEGGQEVAHDTRRSTVDGILLPGVEPWQPHGLTLVGVTAEDVIRVDALISS